MGSTTLQLHLKEIVWSLCISVALLLIATPEIAAAQSKYVPLTGIPGVTPGSTNLAGLLNALYILAISLGALFAVIKIAIAGVKYSTSGDNASARSSAKNDIYGALFGLAILLATYIVLNQINPNLTSLNILGNAKPAVLTNTSLPADTPTESEKIAKNNAVLKNCSPADVKMTPSGACCAGSSDASIACTAPVASSVDSVTQIDSSKVYQGSELNQLIQQLQSNPNVVVSASPAAPGSSYDPSYVSALCAQLPGSTPTYFKQRVGSGGTALTRDRLVCVKK